MRVSLCENRTWDRLLLLAFKVLTLKAAVTISFTSHTSPSLLDGVLK